MRPPYLAEAIVRWFALPEDRDFLVDDLRSRFREVADDRGRRGAVVWYLRQVLGVVSVRLPFWTRRDPSRRSDRGPEVVRRPERAFRLADRAAFSWLDLKLGVRMFAKYPGLSLASVAGMATATAIATGGFGFLHAAGADLPLPEGDRVVIIQNSDPTTPGIPDRRATRDFLRWRERLSTVLDISAFRTDRVSVSGTGAPPAPATVARMTASGFRTARVEPVFGRTLVEEDQREGAPLVVVVAYREWQRRFGGDPDLLGRVIRMGLVEYSVVGVMPEGFRFPVNHGYWIPLVLDETIEPGQGPEITVFGRLAEGASVARAQTELTTIGSVVAGVRSDARAGLRPRVLDYTDSFIGVDGPFRAWLMRSLEVALSLLLVLVAVNVSVLVFARTTARMGEIATRTALGASRARVVLQLFWEALVTSSIAALVGLGATVFGFSWMRRMISFGNAGDLPFWIDLRLTPELALYATVLALMAAVITGVLPGLQATGKAIQTNLQELHAGATRMRLGRVWTALIVTQVAVAVAVLPYALSVADPSVRRGLVEPDYPVDEFLRGALAYDDDASRLDGDTPIGTGSRFLASVEEFARRLEAEPAVAGVAVMTRYPGSESVTRIEVEGSAGRAAAWVSQVGTNLLDLLDVPVLAGRGFSTADVVPGATAVVVDEAFVDELLGGRDVLGTRVRLISEETGGSSPNEGAWLEIVGVVPMFTVPPAFQPVAPKLYRPLTLGDQPDRLMFAIRMRGDTPPLAFAGRLRAVADELDPGLRMSAVETAADAERERQSLLIMLAAIVIAVSGSVLLLSAAGIYAMMSFTVTSRRREIGVRAALGAAPGRVLSGILRRAVRQLATGVVCGLLVSEVTVRLFGGSFVSGEGAYLGPFVAIAITVIGLLAAFGPARRGLTVQPTEALRGQ